VARSYGDEPWESDPALPQGIAVINVLNNLLGCPQMREQPRTFSRSVSVDSVATRGTPT
jgi:hypothetical protein